MYHLLQHITLAVIICCNMGIAADTSRRAALIVIDVQECFLPGGSLAVTNGNAVLPIINSIRENNTFQMVVFSLDWHPRGHVSFASSHNKSVMDTVALRYLQNGTLCLTGTVTSTRFPNATSCDLSQTKTVDQTLWPDHCVQDVSTGPTSSKLSDALKRSSDDVIVYKGTHKEIDSYSAFFDNGNFTSTDLNNQLKAKKINTVFITGFALDYCVFYTSMDAKRLGYDTYTVTDASVGIDSNNVADASKKLSEMGVHLINHTEIPGIMKGNPGQDGSSNSLAPCLVLILSTLISSRKLVPC